MRPRLTRLIPWTLLVPLFAGACAKGSRLEPGPDPDGQEPPPASPGVEPGDDGAGTEDGDLGLSARAVPSERRSGIGAPRGVWRPPPNDRCDGADVLVLLPGDFESARGTLIGATDDYPASCAAAAGGAKTPDVVYELAVVGGGRVSIYVNDHVGDDGFDGMVSVRSQACGEIAAQDVCMNDDVGSEPLEIDLAPGTHWLIIDSASAKGGDFALTATLDPPRCGDGFVNDRSSGEECDSIPWEESSCYPPGHGQECKLIEP